MLSLDPIWTIIDVQVEEKKMTKAELERDRDGWKGIAVTNSEIIDRLRAEIDSLKEQIEDRDLEESHNG